MKKLITIIFLSLFSLTLQAGDVEAGKKAYATCANCHGSNGEGNATLNAPSLGGQHDWYLKRHLGYFMNRVRGFEKGDTFGNQMAPMALTLIDETGIDNVVAYINTLPAADAPATIQGNVDNGKALYGNCAACHGANGEGNDALNAPKLAGQHDWYLARQLKYYKSGTRGNNPNDTYGATMVGMAALLADDQAINDVVSYINTLQ